MPQAILSVLIYLMIALLKRVAGACLKFRFLLSLSISKRHTDVLLACTSKFTSQFHARKISVAVRTENLD